MSIDKSFSEVLSDVVIGARVWILNEDGIKEAGSVEEITLGRVGSPEGIMARIAWDGYVAHLDGAVSDDPDADIGEGQPIELEDGSAEWLEDWWPVDDEDLNWDDPA
jgi:hypothetical protein